MQPVPQQVHTCACIIWILRVEFTRKVLHIFAIAGAADGFGSLLILSATIVELKSRTLRKTLRGLMSDNFHTLESRVDPEIGSLVGR